MAATLKSSASDLESSCAATPATTLLPRWEWAGPEAERAAKVHGVACGDEPGDVQCDGEVYGKGIAMQTKLTLRLDARLIRRAKTYARRRGKSLSQIVTDFFVGLDQPGDVTTEARSPAVRSLTGALAGHGVAEEQYRGYLARKHH
jgi:hypothetical protein